MTQGSKTGIPKIPNKCQIVHIHSKLEILPILGAPGFWREGWERSTNDLPHLLLKMLECLGDFMSTAENFGLFMQQCFFCFSFCYVFLCFQFEFVDVGLSTVVPVDFAMWGGMLARRASFWTRAPLVARLRGALRGRH